MNASLKRSALLAGSAAAVAGLATALLSRKDLLSLSGRVVLITGGSRGLGLALARAFAEQGASLAICARNEEELDAAKRDLASRGADVMKVPCDVGDQTQVQNMIDTVIGRHGRLDVLVNNAGIIQVGPLGSMSVEDFEQTMNVMFWGTVHTTLAALPHLSKRGQGRVVNITSVGGRVSVPHLVPYSCAKFATAAFSEGLRAELQGSGVKVVTISPGLMRTGSYLNAIFKGDQEGEAAWFGVSASLPGLSMSADRAAGQIVRATRTGQPGRILGLPANVLARFHGLFPGATAEILGVVNHLLPSNRPQSGRGFKTRALRKPSVYALTALGRYAAKRFLQPGASQL